jgi:CheY-like chemotaxis protein
MTKSGTETAFLAQVVSYDDTAEGRRLRASIHQAQQDEHSVRRAVRLTALLVVLSAVGICYWKVFLTGREFLADDVTWWSLRFVANGFWGLGVGSLISLLGLLGLFVVYHRRNARLRQEGRRFAARLLESRLAKATTLTTLPAPGVVLKEQGIFLELLNRTATVVPTSNSTSSSELLLESCVSSGNAQSGAAVPESVQNLPLILVVDDNQDDVMLITRAFERTGLKHAIQSVSSGTEGIGYLNGAPPFDDRITHPLPQLVLLDIKMPSVDGFDVLRWIRHQPQFAQLCVVMLTSSDEMRDVNLAYQLGANSFLIKPLDFSNAAELCRSISKRVVKPLVFADSL